MKDYRSQLRLAFGADDALDSDVLEELAQHAAASYSAARAEGCDAAEAERRVDLQIRAWATDPSQLKRRPRRAPAVEPPAGSASPMSSIVQDARYALRLLRRKPAYAALVIATMALGIAATTVLGSVAYGVLLKPLPWADAPRLVRLYETREGSTKRFGAIFTNGTYLAWRDARHTLDEIGAWTTERVAPSDQPGAPRITIGEVTPSMFPMLQAAPALGHGFAPNDDEPGRPAVTILSYGLWQQQFGGRADVIGSSIRFDRTTYTIVGVMPASFEFPTRETRAWIPFYVQPSITPGREGMSISMFQAIGRLKPGVTAAQAAAEGSALGRAAVPATQIAHVIAMAVFGSDGQIDVTAMPLLDSLTADVRPAILILFAAVVLLLATATANVASLQLARATARQRELAIRAAIGAARGRLVRQTLVENVMLGLLGGAAGVLLGALLHRALPSILPANFPRLDDIAFGWRIETFAVAISLLAGLGCGVLPALHAARADVAPTLAEAALAAVGGGLRTKTARARGMIMAAQVATACVLLVGAVLLTRSYARMMKANLGYDPTNVLTARLVLADGAFTPERRLAIADQVTERLSTVPGVLHAAYSNSMAFGSGEALSSFPLKRRDGSSMQIQSGMQAVSPDYFASMGQRIVEGRGFSTVDQSSGQPVAIVNREFSRKYLEGKALGWALPGSSAKHNAPPAPDRPIVGIVEDTVRRSVTDAPQPQIYQVVRRDQGQINNSDVYFVVRTSSDPQALVPTLRDIVRNAAPSAPLESVMTMRDRVADTLANPRLYAVLLGVFALFGLLIAGVGLFGVLSYSVAQRAREIGVRTALGAQVSDIVGLVLRQSLAIALTGVVCGIVASFWISTALRQFLYGVTPHDAVSFAVVGVVLLLVSALATIVPAKRAASVDPVRVLRT